MSTQPPQLTEKQAEFILNKSRYKVANWGRRSGKTSLFAWEAFGTALERDNARITYYAQTFGDARDIAWDIFLDTFGDAVAKKNESRLEITLHNVHGGTSLVTLKGWESVVTSGKGRGTENDLLLFDEVAFCRLFMEHWQKTLEPTLLTSKGRAVFGSTPNGFNDFYMLSKIAQGDPAWFYSHATSYDNPHNDPAELEKLRANRGEDAFAQEYLADFRKLEGLVYKEFDRTRHVVEQIPLAKVVAKRGAIDFGHTNPAGILTVYKDNDARYFISAEYYEVGKVQSELNQEMQSRSLESWYPDPAEPDRIEEMRRSGLVINEVSKDVTKGIDTVKTLLRQQRLFIHNDCKNLLFEIDNYRYKPRRPEQNEQEEPIKENDHLLDAMRYALHMWETVSQTSGAVREHYEQLKLRAKLRHKQASPRAGLR